MARKQKRFGNGVMDGFKINDSEMDFSGMDFGGDIGNINMGFSQDYDDDDVVRNNPRAPELISNNYDEPSDIFNIDSKFMDGESSMGLNAPKFPKLTETMGNIMEKRSDGRPQVTIIRKKKRTPLTDEEADRDGSEDEVIVVQKKRIPKRFKNFFEDIRYQELDRGGNPLSAEEELNFSRGRSYRGLDVFENT